MTATLDLREVEQLELQQLQRIPSMGGHLIGEFLYRLGREHRGLGDVVEVGSWLGSSCAHIALGLRHAGSTAAIHCYDRFWANEHESQKAAQAGVAVGVGQDTEPIFRRHVEPIYPHVRSHKVDLRDVTWSGGPIEVYIDDAAKQRQKFIHVMRTFGPSFIAGTTRVVLMDFSMHRHTHYTAEKRRTYLTQKRAMSQLRRHFRLEHLDWPRSSMACFRYIEPLDFSRFAEILGPDPAEGRLRAALHRLRWRLTHR